MHDAGEMGRFLAICGWLARLVRRPFRRTPIARVPTVPVVAAVLLLAGLAAAPIAVPLLDPQPADIGVPAIFDGEVTEPGTWVRIVGRAFPLSDSPTGEEGHHALLVDADRLLRAIVARSATPFEPVPPDEVRADTYTGRLFVVELVAVEEDLPIEATEAGTPPRVVPDRILELDAEPKPPRTIWWPLAILPALLAGMLVAGVRTGYPVFLPTKEIDVLVTPLAVGERLPAAWGGRIGPNRSELADPAAALLLVRRGDRGGVLTAQPLVDGGGPSPAPVPVGGGWTAGRIGYVHTVTESVPALEIRSELVDATFLFARTGERDRVAALVSVDR